MFILGHVGLTTGVVHGIDRKVDLRWVPFAALLPDIIDKPLDVVLPSFTNGWSRTVGHSLCALVIVSLIAFAWRGRKGWPFALAYALHLVLDRMWLRVDGPTLLWPFFGFWFDVPWHPEGRRGWQDIWILGGEAAGFAILIVLAVRGRLWEAGERRAFLATGVLRRPSDVSPAPAGSRPGGR